MNDPNLNPNPVSAGPKERFDLKKHVHQQGPFFSGVKMFVSVVVSLAALSVALLGGTYLLVTGPPSDFYQKPSEEGSGGTSENDAPGLPVAAEKSVQDKVTELMAEYQSGWNSGTFPSRLVTSGFTARSKVGKVMSSQGDYYNPRETIDKLKVAGVAQISGSEVAVVTYELVRYSTGIKNWYMNSGGSDQEGDLIVLRVIEHEYRLVDSGGWKIRSREWKRDSPAMIQQAGEATANHPLSVAMDEGTVQFDDRRPSRESLSPFYQAIASELQSGYLSYTTFPSSYTVTFDTGGTLDRSVVQSRLSKLQRNVEELKFTFYIESVEQTGVTSAEATVRFSAEFVPVDSDARNQYVAVWRDKDTWTRASDTDTTWTRTATQRILRSPIWQHYENKKPPEPPAQTTPTYDYNYNRGGE
jgi:hypothetical protein